MFSKFLGSTIFKKFVGASILAILVATLAPTAAHAAPSVTPSTVFQVPDVGQVVTVTGSGFDNGAFATLSDSASHLPVTFVDSGNLLVTLPAHAFSPGTTSASLTLTITNLDSSTSTATVIYYASIPAYTTTATLGGGIAGKTISLNADSTCVIPQPCYFDSSVGATIQFGAGALTPISISPNAGGTSATLILPAHAMSAALAADIGHVVIQNPNGMSSTLDFTYYATPNVSFAAPGTSGAPNLLAVGAAMSTINLAHSSGYCTTMTPSSVNPIPGVTWSWNAVTQTGTLTGTPSANTASTLFTATCANPADPTGSGANSVASIYLSASRLTQSVTAFSISGATGTAPNYTATFGNSGLAYSFTTSPLSGGGAVSVTSSDACVTVDQVAKTLTLVCVPAGAVTLTATAASTATYDASSPVTATLTLSKATQTIPTFTISGATGTAPNYASTFGTTGLTYSFTTNPVSGGGAVTVTSSDACVSVDQLAKTLAITCVPLTNVTLTATAAATGNYIGPVTKTATLSITKGQLGVTFAPILQMISGGPAQDLSMNAAITPTGIGSPYVISYSVAPASSTVCSLNGTNHTLTALAEGNCVVTANVAGDGNMLAAVAQTRTIVVKLAAAQVITYSGISATYVYGNADVTFHVTDLFGDAIQVSNILTTTATLTQLNATTYTMHIVQAGNGKFSAYDPLTKTRTDFSFVVSPKPVTLAPSMASVAANGTVTFDPIAIVGLLPGDFVQVDASQVVGSYSATGLLSWTGAFKLTGSAAQNYTIAAQPLSFAVHPVIFNVTPAFGSPVGGNTITITGAGFTPTAQVSFGTSVAASVHYVSSSTLQVVTPAHAVGTTSIVVAMNGVGSVSSPVNFEFKPLAPVITSVTPGTSVITGGTVIQIVGENFAPDITVTLDGAPIGVQSVTPHELTFSTPAHAAGAVKLVIANPGLPSVTWTSDLVYILPISVTPPSVTKAWTSGGLKVKVSGENFAAGVTVTVQGIAATNVLVVDPKTLSFFLPAVTNTGLADIVIKTAENQTITLPGAVNFVATPTAKMTFGAATTVTSKGLKALKRFVTQVKKAGLKLTTLQVSIYAKSSTPTAAEAKAAKLFAKAVRSALTRLGLRVRGTNLVSGASGAMKNSVIITGN